MNNITKISEGMVLKQCLQFLSYHPKVAWAHRMNSGARTKEKDGKKGRPIRFSFPGMSDIIGQLTDGRFLAVEVKRPEYAYGEKKDCAKKLSRHQELFLMQVEEANGCACVVDCIEDLEWFLGKV